MYHFQDQHQKVGFIERILAEDEGYCIRRKLMLGTKVSLTMNTIMFVIIGHLLSQAQGCSVKPVLISKQVLLAHLWCI